MGRKEREQAVNAIAIGRIAVGAGAWLTPNLSGRLFGARDVVLGAGVLRSSRKQKDAWVTAGLACDVADVAAGALAGARGQLPPAAAALVTATAGTFALAGYWLLQQ